MTSGSTSLNAINQSISQTTMSAGLSHTLNFDGVQLLEKLSADHHLANVITGVVELDVRHLERAIRVEVSVRNDVLGISAVGD